MLSLLPPDPISDNLNKMDGRGNKMVCQIAPSGLAGGEESERKSEFVEGNSGELPHTSAIGAAHV